MSEPAASRRPAATGQNPSRVWRRRLAALGWVVTCAAIGGILFWAYRKYVLGSPDPTLTYVYKDVKYELLNPKLLGVVLVFPWFIGVLSKSLADLPSKDALRAQLVGAVQGPLSQLVTLLTAAQGELVRVLEARSKQEAAQ